MKSYVRRSLWTFSRLLAVIPPAVLLLFALWAIDREFHSSRYEIVRYITSEVGRSLEVDIAVGKVDASDPGVLVVSDVTIDKEGFGRLGSAGRATIRYNLMALVRDYQNAASHINSVALDRAHLRIVRQEDGSINLVEAFRPRRPRRPSEPFRGTVEVRESSVTFTDETTARAGRAPVTVRGEGIAAQADFGSGNGATFQGKIARTNASGRLDVDGIFSNSGKVVVGVEGVQVSLGFVDRYLQPDSGPLIQAGLADGRFLLTSDPERETPVHFYADAAVREGVLNLPGGIPQMTAIAGDVRISNTDAITFDVRGRSLGSEWEAAGVVSSLAEPVLWVDASTRSAQFSQLVALAPRETLPADLAVSGSGPLNVKLRGALASPEVFAVTVVPQASWQGTFARNIRVKANYRQDNVSVQASADLAEGRVAANARVGLGSQPVVEGSARFTGMGLSAIPAGVLPGPVAGTASGDATFWMSGGVQRGAVTFQVANPSGFGVDATSLRGDVEINGRQIVVDSLLLSTPGGFVTATGDVSLDGELDLAVTAMGVRVQEVAERAREAGIAGVVDGQGTLTGAMTDPVFSGTVQGLDLRVDEYALDTVQGEVTVSRNAVSTSGLTATLGTNEVVLSGNILSPLSEQRVFDLDMQVRSLEASQLAEYVPALGTVQGRLEGSVTDITGVYPDIRASFDLRAEGVQYEAFSAPVVTARGVYDAGALRMEDLRAEISGGRLLAEGILDEGGALDFQFTMLDFPMTEIGRLGLRREVPVSGRVDLVGYVRGTVQDPSVEAVLGTRNITIAGEPVVADHARIFYADNRLSVEGGSLQVAGGRVILEDLAFATAGDEAGLSSGRIVIGSSDGEQPEDAVSIGRLLAIVRSLGFFSGLSDQVRAQVAQAPERTQGVMTGAILLGREDGEVTASVDLEGRDVSAWGVQLGSVDLEASMGPQGYEVAQLLVEDGDMQVTASGSMGPLGALEANVDGYNFALTRIPNIQSYFISAGEADFSFTAQGSVVNPQVEGSVLVTDATIAGVDVEQITTGLVQMDAERVVISDATITRDANGVRLEGTIPFSITQLAFVPDEEIDLRASLQNPDLDFVSLFVPRVDVERTSGELIAQVNVTGQWPRPEINGEVSVSDGILAIQGMDTLLRDIQVDLALQGDRVGINEFRITSSDGGVLRASGEAALGAEGWRLDARAETSNFGLRLRNVSGVFDETFSGELDVDVTASGPVMQPLIAGKLEMHDGFMGLPSIPDERQEGKAIAFNPSFDLVLEAGRDLRVRGPRLNVGVRGMVQLAQTLANPSLTGNLNVISGYLLFPGSRFRVVPVGSINFAYEPPDTTRVTLDIRAETTISASVATAPMGAPNYRVEMAVRGPLDDPTVSFQSYPPGLETSRILAMLGQQAGVGPSGFQGGASFEREVAQLFTANIAPGVFEPVELAIAEALGFEEVTLGYTAEDSLNVQLTRRLFDGVSITIWESFAAGQEQTAWKFTYDITDRLRLSYGENRFGLETISLEGFLRF